MRKRLWTITAGAAVLAALALAGATLAAGGSSAGKKSAKTTTGSVPARTPETPLTGDVLAKVTAAAIAKAGGTVDMATTENDSSNSAAAYEAHVTKADGTHVTVILDKDYNVLAVETGGHGGFGPGGFGPGGPGGHGETPLTGDVATKAKAAAVAKTGGTADFAMTESDSSNAAAAYQVLVTKTDGSHARVVLDKDYNVLSVDAGPGFGPGGRGPLGGPGGPGPNGETPLAGDVATKATAAAVAKTGGTADFASTENDSSNAAAAYEVHVTKADGTHVSAILDKDYNVLTVETHTGP